MNHQIPQDAKDIMDSYIEQYHRRVGLGTPYFIRSNEKALITVDAVRELMQVGYTTDEVMIYRYYILEQLNENIK